MLPELQHGRYQNLAPLGNGGFASTYTALDTKTQTQVVLKILHFAKLENWKGHELFEREAKILKQLDHPFIPNFMDFFEEPDPDERLFVLVTECVKGVTLAEKQANGWQCSEKEAIKLMHQALDILEYLHEFQPPIIHRDLKPSNLMVNESGQLYFIDFGAVQEALKPQGQGGSTIIGTFGYMAPEQFTGHAFPSSDLYALGATFLELLGGRPPSDYPQKSLKLDFVASLALESSVLSRVLNKLLEPDPNQRFQNVTEVRKALKKPELQLQLKEDGFKATRQGEILTLTTKKLGRSFISHSLFFLLLSISGLLLWANYAAQGTPLVQDMPGFLLVLAAIPALFAVGVLYQSEKTARYFIQLVLSPHSFHFYLYQGHKKEILLKEGLQARLKGFQAEPLGFIDDTGTLQRLDRIVTKTGAYIPTLRKKRQQKALAQAVQTYIDLYDWMESEEPEHSPNAPAKSHFA